MLDNLAHLKFFPDIFTFSGLPTLLNCYFVSSILKYQIGKISTKVLVKIIDASTYLHDRNYSQKSVLLNGCTFDKITITQTISNWTHVNWKDIFVNQVSKEEIMPKLIKKMIQRRYYHRMNSAGLNALLERLLGDDVVRYRTKRHSKPLTVSESVELVLKEKKQTPIKGFKNIVDLFVLHPGSTDRIVAQRISFPNIVIILNGIEYNIPKVNFFTKKMVSWGNRHVNQYEIIIENENNSYIGAITSNGTYYPRCKIIEPSTYLHDIRGTTLSKNNEFVDFLNVLQEHHLALCKTIGIITKKCVFCTRDLTDPVSLLHGYGKCASTHRLPWGQKKRKNLQ
jgi:hypothetical protein